MAYSSLSFWLLFLKIITIYAFFHIVGIRLSDMHFVYSLARALVMLSSPTVNISMLTSSFPVAFPFFIFFSAASTSHVVTDGTSLGSVRTVMVVSLS